MGISVLLLHALPLEVPSVQPLAKWLKGTTPLKPKSYNVTVGQYPKLNFEMVLVMQTQ